MDNRLYYIELYDIYGTLLTLKQQTYFEDYYFSNLSLSEISENMEVSRNAIHKQIKETEEKLQNFNNHLKLYEKNKEIKKLITNIDEKLQNKILDILQE